MAPIEKRIPEEIFEAQRLEREIGLRLGDNITLVVNGNRKSANFVQISPKNSWAELVLLKFEYKESTGKVTALVPSYKMQIPASEYTMDEDWILFDTRLAEQIFREEYMRRTA